MGYGGNYELRKVVIVVAVLNLAYFGVEHWNPLGKTLV